MPDDPRVEVKPMFGNVAAFVNGNMFMGLFGPAIGVRLDEAARAELDSIARSAPFGPEDRPMKEYVAMPLTWRDDADATEAWVTRALGHTAAMPPKKKR